MNREKAETALQIIAEKEGVSVQEVRLRIQEAIDMAIANPDPFIRKFWESIPHQGERPSFEEVICFLSDEWYSYLS